MIRFLAVAISATLLVPAAPAHASDAPSVAVSYADLDLTTSKGQNRLNARIGSAARAMCAVDGVRDLRRLMAAKACYRTAIASVQPQLAALAEKSKRAVA